MKGLIICFFFFNGIGVTNAQTTTPTKSDINTDTLKKDLVTNPSFSSSSVDQVKKDEVVKKSQEQMGEMTTQHILKIDSCKKFHSIEEVQKCKKEQMLKK